MPATIICNESLWLDAALAVAELLLIV